MTNDHPYNCIQKVCNHLKDAKKVDCIVAGCTDIRNVYDGFLWGGQNVARYVDSLEVLAKKIIKDTNEKNDF